MPLTGDLIEARGVRAIILSGGPSSVYAEGAPSLDRSLFEAGVPVFGMCYGFQLMATTLGGTVDVQDSGDGLTLRASIPAE